MFNPESKHCEECLCLSCMFFQAVGCLEGDELCEKCSGEAHTTQCPWFLCE